MDTEICFSIRSSQAGCLSNPCWETTIDAEVSSEGSNGVVFILTSAGSYVVKASSRPAEELFASRIFAKVGVAVPMVRCVGHTENEWMEIKNAIKQGAKYCNARGDSIGSQKLKQRLGGPLDRPQLLIMELVSGASALEGNISASKIFGDFRVNSFSRHRLRVLGKILAIDIFLNNSDRIPSQVWDNDGNGGNIMIIDKCFCARDEQFILVPIDSVSCTLKV